MKSADRSRPAPPIQAAANSGLARGSEAKDPEGHRESGSDAMARRTAVEMVERPTSCLTVTLHGRQ